MLDENMCGSHHLVLVFRESLLKLFYIYPSNGSLEARRALVRTLNNLPAQNLPINPTAGDQVSNCGQTLPTSERSLHTSD